VAARVSRTCLQPVAMRSNTNKNSQQLAGHTQRPACRPAEPAPSTDEQNASQAKKAPLKCPTPSIHPSIHPSVPRAPVVMRLVAVDAGDGFGARVQVGLAGALHLGFVEL